LREVLGQLLLHFDRNHNLKWNVNNLQKKRPFVIGSHFNKNIAQPSLYRFCGGVNLAALHFQTGNGYKPSQFI